VGAPSIGRSLPNGWEAVRIRVRANVELGAAEIVSGLESPPGRKIAPRAPGRGPAIEIDAPEHLKSL
jgi:hypothetical protein